MSPHVSRKRRARVAVLLGTVVAALALVAAGCGDDEESTSANSTEAAALQDAMRAAWQEHGTLTMRAIVSAVEETPATEAVVGKLLENQLRIGDAVKPYYGEEAGNALTKLLEEHINTAVATVGAAKSGDEAAVEMAKDAFYANGDEVAGFLNEANPENWPLDDMKEMMTTHLDHVVELAVLQIEGKYEAALDLYDEYINHILVGMADMLSSGIAAQFPEKFE